MSLKVPKNILELSQEEKRQFVDSFDLVLHDCDGVLWTLTGGLPGVQEGIDALYKLNKELGFVSNNSVSGQEKYESKFKALGVKFDYEKQLIHPAESFAAYLNKIQFDKSKNIFLVGTSEHRKMLDKNGYKFTTARNSYGVEDVGGFYKAILSDFKGQKVDAVCFDVDIDLNMAKLWLMEYFLNKNPECLLLIGGTDSEYQIVDYSFQGMGTFVNNLVARCKQVPIYLGKPGDELAEIVIEKYKITDRSRILFVGDTLKQDIGFAQKNGFQTLLVFSGVTTKDMLSTCDKPEEIPDYVADSVFDFVKFNSDLQK